MTAKDRKLPVVLSRNDLYQQVWTDPLIRLGAKYGITGTGLAKICARLNVPCPPRGYWAKKAAGKPVIQYRLPEPDAETPLQVTITPAPPPAQPSQAQTETLQQIAKVREAHAELIVPLRLSHPHAAIAQWLADHERKKQEALRERDPTMRRTMQPQPFTDIDRRTHRILDALFKAIEPLGFTIKAEQYQRVYFEFKNERIDFQIREKQKQVRRPLTEDEKRWSYNRDRGWIQELQPTGVLIFTIKTWLAKSMRQDWKDEPDKPLENDLPEIVATLSLAGPFLVKQRQARAEAEKRHWDEERQRHLERQRQEQDDRRWQKFMEFARHLDEAAAVRRLLVELEAKPQPNDFLFDGLSPTEWLNWARERLAKFDPLLREPYDLYEELAHIEP